MPREVDHEQRRSRIIEATVDLIAVGGLAGATMRAIADAVGCTTGMLMHYFADKDEILREALIYTDGRSLERKLAAIQMNEPQHRLRAVIEEALPLDAERAKEWKVWLAFWGAASVSEELSREQRARYDQWTEFLADVMGHPEQEKADGLVALIDGLGLRGVLEPTRLTPARQMALIDDYLVRQGINGVAVSPVVMNDAVTSSPRYVQVSD